jgi:hypothetical protein
MPRKKQPKSAVVASTKLSVKAEDGERQPSEQGTNTDGTATESLTSPTTVTTSTTRMKKRKRKNFDEAEDDSFVLPHERKTEAGGYAHTNLSKSKISKANTGNTPWNKGRNRSSADRAKIASGVRARNRAQLLKKLKKLGLSEDEWNLKKKEIKYLRERVRRAKATNSKHKAALAEKQLAEMLKATGKQVKKRTKTSEASKQANISLCSEFGSFVEGVLDSSMFSFHLLLHFLPRPPFVYRASRMMRTRQIQMLLNPLKSMTKKRTRKRRRTMRTNHQKMHSTQKLFLPEMSSLTPIPWEEVHLGLSPTIKRAQQVDLVG